MIEWAKTSAVSLQFDSTETCKFDRKETREVDSSTQNVTELSVGGVVKAALTSKTVTTVTDYFWKFEVSYKLQVVRSVGSGEGDRLLVLSRTGRAELKTSSEM